MVRGELKRVRLLWIKAIPTNKRLPKLGADARENAQWRVDNCVWCPQKLGQQRKSNEKIALNKKRICKKERSYQTGSSSMCSLLHRRQERVPPFSLQKEMRDFASKTYEKAKRSNPCKLGRNPRKKLPPMVEIGESVGL